MFDVEVNNSNNLITDAEAELLKENIIFFCGTPRGSLPQMRDFGLDFAIMDEPYASMRVKATVDIITGIRKFYGIQITNIDISADGNGAVKIKISI